MAKRIRLPKKRNSIVLMLVVFLSLFSILYFTLKEDKNLKPLALSLQYGFSAQIPSGWQEFQKPSANQIVLVNSGQGDNQCFLDIFVVQPDKDYSFEQWLGTALTNEIFLQTGKQTTLKDKQVFLGSYNFTDNYFKKPVNHQRAIIKDDTTLVDLHMSYDQNATCLNDFQDVLNSITF